ncbi:1967_t:CDS:2 [Paraglomus occultum]|uniref:Hydroxymethylglutaryl-CoA synthase n=1 Tax=Paraglomus occultum TaxID=144539 RepID=A0A9N9B542_9GLOM|nr:1967_t:CDS:2 [Paraglomus occultum]
MAKSYPENVGIVAIEIYFPKRYVDQAEYEQFNGVSAGRYTVGLGTKKMGYCDDREDVNSIALTSKTTITIMDLMNLKYVQLPATHAYILPAQFDKSKSVKTVLMTLFADSGNTDVEGIDTMNACYGGTNALFNAVNWIESSSWDGRYALVVAGDIAVYASGPARPTGGAGCVAMLVGKDAPIVFESGLRASHMEHVYDFYKPDSKSEYPTVDGHLSNTCYLRALDKCYTRYLERLEAKALQKSFARLFYNDFRRNPDNPDYSSLKNFTYEESLTSKDLEKSLLALSKADFLKKVSPSLDVSSQVGNMYCASLYGCLVSLVSNIPSDDLLNKRIGMFSYGSGLASTFFSVRITSSVTNIANNLNLHSRLQSRIQLPPAKFEEIMSLREGSYGNNGFVPVGDGSAISDVLFEGTYYLANVDDKWRREYKRL